MKKYLAYYETEWPANIAELTAVENKPFVGYLKGLGVLFTVIPEPVTGPANNEIWYTTTDNQPYDLANIILGLTSMGATYNGPNVVSNEYDTDKEMYVMTFDDDITLLGNLDIFEMIADGPVFITASTYGIACNVENIILPNSVTSIGYNAFYCCSSLTSITIPNSVTSIGNYAFKECSSLTSITIPNSVTSINDHAFYYCSSLTSITIPNSVTSIGDHAFDLCDSLASITIPNSIMSIGQKAFVSCYDLTSITYEGTVEQWNSISKGSDWHHKVPATYVQCSDGQVTL